MKIAQGLVAALMLATASTAWSAAAPDDRYVAGWATTLDAPSPLSADQVGRGPTTLTETVDIAVSGDKVRLRFSNLLGAARLEIARASVGVASEGVALRFRGKPDAALPPGMAILSDPLKLSVKRGDRLRISFVLKPGLASAPVHNLTLEPWAYAGDAAPPASVGTDEPDWAQPWRLVDRVLVRAEKRPVLAVALGDSLTDGDGDITSKRETWPWIVSTTGDLVVLNLARAGSRLERDGIGLSGVHRLQAEALAIPAVKVLFLEFGLNDIGFPGVSLGPRLLERADATPGEQELEGVFTDAIDTAHRHGVCVVVATVPPFHDADLPGYFSEDKERTRQAVNTWLRRATPADAVMDIDARLQDPASPGRLAPVFKSQDGLHPNHQGQEVMAQAARSAFDRLKAECKRPGG